MDWIKYYLEDLEWLRTELTLKEKTFLKWKVAGFLEDMQLNRPYDIKLPISYKVPLNLNLNK